MFKYALKINKLPKNHKNVCSKNAKTEKNAK